MAFYLNICQHFNLISIEPPKVSARADGKITITHVSVCRTCGREFEKEVVQDEP
jgi:hypothetical protein